MFFPSHHCLRQRESHSRIQKTSPAEKKKRLHLVKDGKPKVVVNGIHGAKRKIELLETLAYILNA